MSTRSVRPSVCAGGTPLHPSAQAGVRRSVCLLRAGSCALSDLRAHPTVRMGSCNLSVCPAQDKGLQSVGLSLPSLRCQGKGVSHHTSRCPPVRWPTVALCGTRWWPGRAGRAPAGATGRAARRRRRRWGAPGAAGLPAGASFPRKALLGFLPCPAPAPTVGSRGKGAALSLLLGHPRALRAPGVFPWSPASTVLAAVQRSALHVPSQLDGPSCLSGWDGVSRGGGGHLEHGDCPQSLSLAWHLSALGESQTPHTRAVAVL